jgi:RND family efflux transporter MFP subunit
MLHLSDEAPSKTAGALARTTEERRNVPPGGQGGIQLVAHARGEQIIRHTQRVAVMMGHAKFLLRFWPMLASILALLPGPRSARAEQVDGFTEPYRTINVAATESGVITLLNVREGDKVRKGQLLASLDADFLEASRDVAKAGKDAVGRLNAAEANIQYKKERLQNLYELRTQGHAYQEEVRRAESELRIAEAERLSAREDQVAKAREYTRTEVQIERRKICSPVDGIVTRLQKQLGEYVPATDTTVLTIVEMDRLLVVFPVPRAAVAGLQAGNKVTVAFADGLKSAEAEVQTVSPVTDPESGTVRVRVAIDNSHMTVPSGVACWLQVGPSKGLPPDSGRSAAAAP